MDQDFEDIEEWRQRVIAAIKQDGRPHRTISQAAGLGQTFIRDFIQRQQTPRVDMLKRLCDEIGITLEFVFAKEPKSSEDIAAEMQKTALGRAFDEAMQLPRDFQKLILDGLRGQIRIAKEQPGGKPPLPSKSSVSRLKKAG